MKRSSQSLVALVILALTSLTVGPVLGQTETCAKTWLGTDGQALPFCTDEEVVQFLRDAEVVGRKQLGVGINRPFRLDLELDGVKARAIFRTVSKPSYRIVTNSPKVFRDDYIFEVAAFELSRLLGIENVPPASLRQVDGRQGSIQLWIEEATMESSRIRDKVAPDHPASWHRQRQLMGFFDQLIDNFDRNPGNILVDRKGRVWFVDHTRTFRRYPYLASPEKLTIVDRDVFARLKELDPLEVERRLQPYLEPVEIDALLERRLDLITHVEGMLTSRGEAGVLLDLAAAWHDEDRRDGPG